MKLTKKILIALVAALCFSACDFESNLLTSSKSGNSSTQESKITSVLISGVSSISYNGTATYTATPVYSGSPTITYEWEIISGQDYAELSSDGKTAQITATNQTQKSQTVVLGVTASDGTNSVEASTSITIAKNGEIIEESSVDSNFALYFDLTNSKVSADNSEWYEISTSKTYFLDDSLNVKFTKENGTSTGLIKIDASDFDYELSVYLSGSMTTGGVKIQSNGNDDINLYLNGVSISSSNYPCVEITKGSAANVVLSGQNTFVDGRTYGTGYGEEYSTTSGSVYTDDDGNSVSCTVTKSAVSEGSDSKGTLYSKGNLNISGSGSLSVVQNYKNCIASKDGILTINGGSFTLKNYVSSSSTGKNGLFGGQGIIVNDGSIDFDGYGIISTSDLRKANAFKTDDEDYTSSYVKINGGTTNVKTYNGKGIAAPEVYISGGNNTFTVTGITTYAENSKTGSYYDADGVKQSNATIKFAPEGIEGDSKVVFSGGTTVVSAPDDGVNVSNSGGNLLISGGFIYVYSKGDGLDSNGNIAISDGVTVVSQTGGGNSAIDCGESREGYSFKVTGGTVFAMGASDMFSESIPSSTTIPMVYSTSLGSSSSSLAVNTSSGENLIAIKNPQTYAAALFVCSKLTNSSSYKFVKNATISGTEYISGTGIYYPASSASGGTSTSVTATTSSSSGSNSPGSNGGNRPGGRF